MTAIAAAIVSPTSEAELLPHTVFRIDIFPLTADRAERESFPLLGEGMITPCYWIISNELSVDDINKLSQEVLVDPILQTAQITQKHESAAISYPDFLSHYPLILQKQYLPGVTDNLASSIKDCIKLLLGKDKDLSELQVYSGQCCFFNAKTNENFISEQENILFNPLIEKLSILSNANSQLFQVSEVLSHTIPQVEYIPVELDDAALMSLSQTRHLALNIEELKAIQNYYQAVETQNKRQALGLEKNPTDVELEIIAQTWSEHCKHKIFNATIHYVDRGYEDYENEETIHSLFKTYIMEPTKTLQDKRKDLLSIFIDNAGIIQWDDDTAICFKVETHNSPSALEPYGGALTGIVGVNRDILGTGLGAKPIFNTDVFCFAHPEQPYLPHERLLPPEAILQGVRKGVEDGGNKSGIPTINGSLFFEPRYRAKPLVFCGTAGVMPITLHKKASSGKYTQVGDAIIMAGGRVGKDGIHGATFSSEALHEGSPVSAVQIGDPLTQKRLTDFLLAAQEQDLITGITDNGAGGLSSSIGEMAELTNGARVNLDHVLLKYPGLAPYEIIISESQERMSISTNRPSELLALAEQYQVEASHIGEFTNTGYFEIESQGSLVANLELEFLHHGLPTLQLKALWEPEKVEIIVAEAPPNPEEILLELLAHPNICSRETLIRQYDHEVQGRSVIKSLMGPLQIGPCDAAVIRPKLDNDKGLVVSNGLCPQYSDWDTYHMTACAVDEAIRNAVAVGCDPSTIVLLDNFCWPDPIQSKRNDEGEHKLAQLVRACFALKDAALAYETPFISGKDSMKNDFDDGNVRLSIPPTLLISAIGSIPDVNKAISMEYKSVDDLIYCLGATHTHHGGSHYYKLMKWQGRYSPHVKFTEANARYKLLYQAIQNNWIKSCHDLSEGGLAIALAECSIGGQLGADICLEEISDESPELRWDEILFSETPSRFIVTVKPENQHSFEQHFKNDACLYLGTVNNTKKLNIKRDDRHQDLLLQVSIEALQTAWKQTPSSLWPNALESEAVICP